MGGIEGSEQMEDMVSTRLGRGPRLLLLVAMLGGLYYLGSGVFGSLSVETVRAALVDAGPVGVLGFLVAFALGNLMSVPGLVFVVASLLAYGQVHGALIALVGSLLAVSTNFWVVRTVGGNAERLPDTRWTRWATGGLENHPIRTVALLRTMFVLAPPVNYALALSPIRFRHYLAGSALGLVLPIAAYAAGIECVVRFLV